MDNTFNYRSTTSKRYNPLGLQSYSRIVIWLDEFGVRQVSVWNSVINSFENSFKTKEILYCFRVKSLK